jgi:glutathione peroxidase-family protein
MKSLWNPLFLQTEVTYKFVVTLCLFLKTKVAGRCPAPYFFLLKEERNKEDNFCRQKSPANSQSHSVCFLKIKTAGRCPTPYFFLLKEERNKEDNFCRRNSKGMKSLWSGV